MRDEIFEERKTNKNQTLITEKEQVGLYRTGK